MIQNTINQEIEQVYLFGFFQVVDIQQVFVSEKTFELICVPNACVRQELMVYAPCPYPQSVWPVVQSLPRPPGCLQAVNDPG